MENNNQEKINIAPRTLTEFRDFRLNNPKVVTLGNGTMLRMMSELEWLDTAKKHNQKDALERHKSSLMSGYVVADSENLVMQKVGTNVKYKLKIMAMK